MHRQMSYWAYRGKTQTRMYLLQPAEIVIDGYDCWHAIDSVGREVALYKRTSLAATSVAPLPGRYILRRCGMV